jgi:hypothetical protein
MEPVSIDQLAVWDRFNFPRDGFVCAPTLAIRVE